MSSEQDYRGSCNESYQRKRIAGAIALSALLFPHYSVSADAPSIGQNGQGKVVVDCNISGDPLRAVVQGPGENKKVRVIPAKGVDAIVVVQSGSNPDPDNILISSEGQGSVKKEISGSRRSFILEIRGVAADVKINSSDKEKVFCAPNGRGATRVINGSQSEIYRLGKGPAELVLFGNWKNLNNGK